MQFSEQLFLPENNFLEKFSPIIFDASGRIPQRNAEACVFQRLVDQFRRVVGRPQAASDCEMHIFAAVAINYRARILIN